MMPYVPKALERISETAIVEHKPTGLPVRPAGRAQAAGRAQQRRECALRALLFAARLPRRLPVLTRRAVQGHTSDPVKDLEAKLKFIQEHVPTRISNVSGRHAGARTQLLHSLHEVHGDTDADAARRVQHCGFGLWGLPPVSHGARACASAEACGMAER